MQYVPTNPIEAEPDKLAVLKKMFGYPQMPQPGTPIPQAKPAMAAQFPGTPEYSSMPAMQPLFGQSSAKPAVAKPSDFPDTPDDGSQYATSPSTTDPATGPQSLGSMIKGGLSGVGHDIAGQVGSAVHGIKQFGEMLGG